MQRGRVGMSERAHEKASPDVSNFPPKIWLLAGEGRACRRLVEPVSGPRMLDAAASRVRREPSRHRRGIRSVQRVAPFLSPSRHVCPSYPGRPRPRARGALVQSRRLVVKNSAGVVPKGSELSPFLLRILFPRRFRPPGYSLLRPYAHDSILTVPWSTTASTCNLEFFG